MENKKDIKKILFEYFGYTAFRPLQEDIIRSVMEGRDTLALLPTGGGKSLCYQVPALALDGVCLVISPLIALMKDQVEALKKKKIDAEAVFSGMNTYQIERILDNATYGKQKFLYLSPERLLTDSFRNRLQYMNISFIAVDEAHCISQWGYDFRPPYLQIAAIRDYAPGKPVLALTATATPAVVDDIQEKLHFPEKNVLSKSFERENLIYFVQKEQDKPGRLIKIAGRLPGTGIVYVRNRRRTVEIANFLIQNKIPAGVYHAGLTAAERDSQQNRWMRNQTRVMVATNAFGMGIDKPDVRFVIHTDLPDSPEAYFQEAGRGGRDGKLSYGILLYDGADLSDARDNFVNSWPLPGIIKSVYNAIGNYFGLAVGSGKDMAYDFDLQSFSDTYKWKPIVVYNALKIIEKEGYLALTEALHVPSQLMYKLSTNDMYRFQVENARFDAFLKVINRIYGGLYTEHRRISEEEIARKSDLKAEDVIKALTQLDKMDVVSYVPRKDKPQVIFVTERIDPANFYLSPENYENRKEAARQRLEAMIGYVNDEHHCRSQILLDYFGEKTKNRCGQCDYCIKRNKVEMSDFEFKLVVDAIKPILKNQPLSPEALMRRIGHLNEDNVIKALVFLKESGKIQQDPDGLLHWAH